jgi:hypothetical protein
MKSLVFKRSLVIAVGQCEKIAGQRHLRVRIECREGLNGVSASALIRPCGEKSLDTVQYALVIIRSAVSPLHHQAA